MNIKKITLILAIFFIFLNFSFIYTFQNAYAQKASYYEFMIPSTLEDHYSLLREKYFYDYAAKKKYGDLRYFVAAILHDVEELKWNKCDLYKKKYGEKCNHFSREKLNSILFYIYSNYPGSCRAEQIYNYVSTVVRYKEESGEYPRFPIETLSYRYGDCEDQAMAVAALLKAAGYITGMYVIHDPKYDINHCVCVCRVPSGIDGEKWRIKEYYNLGYCWLMLDPAYHHRFGNNPCWVKNYLKKSGYLLIPDKAANCLLVDYCVYKEFCNKTN